MRDIDLKAAKAAFEMFQELTGIKDSETWHGGPILTWDKIDITTRAIWIRIAIAAREAK